MEIELDVSTLALLRSARQLGALNTGGPLSDKETLVTSVAESLDPIENERIEALRSNILNGEDPLGTAYAGLRDTRSRRRAGLFYTDPQIVRPMVSWVLGHGPSRVVDAGCGSGRFSMAVAMNQLDLPILAIDTDPIATVLCRANLAVIGATNVRVLNDDFTHAKITSAKGKTAFVGNPPYVRHHELTSQHKKWVEAASRELGCRTSKLAGLHVYFFLATALRARAGDIGCYITSAEWLDTNYGTGIRELMLSVLGLESFHLFGQESVPFPEAMTTAVVTCFEVGRNAKTVRFRKVSSARKLEGFSGGRSLPTSKLAAASQWRSFFHKSSSKNGNGLVRLGDFATVHRGVVTGRNRFYVMSRGEAEDRGLSNFVRPVLTSAQDVLQSRGVIHASAVNKVVLAPERNVALELADSAPLLLYLEEGERLGVPSTYICSHRRPWWYIGARQPPPIVSTYMARQAPAFALNPDGLLILNVIHGIYPKEPLDPAALEQLVGILNSARETFRWSGRLYHGGLQKLEPREMEALLVPMY